MTFSETFIYRKIIPPIFRSLPNIKGKHRIARLIFGKGINNIKDVSVTGKFNCTYLLPNLSENVGFDIFIDGVYELDSHKLLADLIPQNGYFVDIGSNIGSITIPLCKNRPDIHAISIEASPWVFKYLEKNILSNKLNNVELINCAIYDEDGLFLDFYSHEDKFGKGSLASVFTNKSIKVATRTIDSILNEKALKTVDVIKVDVEGFEYFVFKGGENYLTLSKAPVIYFEFIDCNELNTNKLQPGDAQKLLLEYGYKLFIVEDNVKKEIHSPLVKGAFNILAIKQ